MFATNCDVEPEAEEGWVVRGERIRPDCRLNHFTLMTLPKDVADDSSVTPAIRIWAGSCPRHDSEAGM